MVGAFFALNSHIKVRSILDFFFSGDHNTMTYLDRPTFRLEATCIPREYHSHLGLARLSHHLMGIHATKPEHVHLFDPEGPRPGSCKNLYHFASLDVVQRTIVLSSRLKSHMRWRNKLAWKVRRHVMMDDGHAFFCACQLHLYLKQHLKPGQQVGVLCSGAELAACLQCALLRS